MENSIIGLKVSYLDDIGMNQKGTIIDFKPSNNEPDILYLSIRNDKDFLNNKTYQYIDKIDNTAKSTTIDCIVRSDKCNLLEE